MSSNYFTNGDPTMKGKVGLGGGDCCCYSAGASAGCAGASGGALVAVGPLGGQPACKRSVSACENEIAREG
uniref:Uncharacterized protein n=1 Tax=Arundo donax TaxID=35708 RepID=A0A0A9DI84_ARUDO